MCRLMCLCVCVCGHSLTSINLLLVINLHNHKLLTDCKRGQSGGNELAEPKIKAQKYFKRPEDVYPTFRVLLMHLSLLMVLKSNGFKFYCANRNKTI